MFSLVTPGKEIAMCSDHAGYEMKNIIIGYLEAMDYKIKDFGTYSSDSCDYADFAHPCADAVETDACFPGIALCGSGNGIGMTLNKHQGIRAALCWTVELAELARRHNNANMLVLPARFIDSVTAINIVDTFLSTPFDGGRHQARIEKMPVK
ncbi:MAG: RpiB/LacA/LacB family sugar-phosphate isomerase [Bacteroides sp.]|nr:RpiB/LacA/LacB family sugar-phosphate isomerase [Bacteroides sp.]MBD5333053.1 RpiB/LacA/LacB family sugar-phosphate isomerase [Bacteroides sp.]